jgi:GntR family transcriptional regulator, trigonelline degradation regulator
MNQVISDLRIAHPPPTLRALAIEKLRGAIITGHFSGGDRLVERALCDQLGVSRSIVREAIRTLEVEGLVENIARTGPIVARLDWPGAAQIYNIRMLLEADAAAACARLVTDDIATQLRMAFTTITAMVSTGNSAQLYQATTEFYQVIFTSAGHHLAWEIVQRLNGRISRLRALTLASTNRRTSGPAHMARICDAICKGDAKAASAAVQDHLRDAAEIARGLLESTP